MKGKVSDNVIRRMPKYLRELKRQEDSGLTRISSTELGRLLGFSPSQIRQDFSSFGEFGVQGYGYNVQSLREQIENILGVNRSYKAILVGCGSIGKSLIHNFCFEEQGISLQAVFDLDTDLIGTKIKGVPVYDALDLQEYLAEHSIDVAVLTVPQSKAKSAAKMLMDCGVHAFWNFTNEEIVPPYSDVLVENVHFSDSLLSLSYYMAERADNQKRTKRIAVGS